MYGMNSIMIVYDYVHTKYRMRVYIHCAVYVNRYFILLPYIQQQLGQNSTCTEPLGTQILCKWRCLCMQFNSDILLDTSVQQAHVLSSHAETWRRPKKLLPTSDAIRKICRGLDSWWWWSSTWRRSLRCDNARSSCCAPKSIFTYWSTMPVRETSIHIRVKNADKDCNRLGSLILPSIHTYKLMDLLWRRHVVLKCFPTYIHLLAKKLVLLTTNFPRVGLSHN